MFIEPSFKNLMMNLTDACNLRCRYCFVQLHPHYMSLLIAKDSIDLLARINKGQQASVGFFGGEPTLMWDEIIVPVMQYSESKNYNIRFSMTSNGQLLDEEKLKYMVQHNMGLLLSIDGIKEVQDFNRPRADGNSSFDALENTLPLIVKYLPNTTFRGTLLPQTCHHLFDNMLFAKDIGFKNTFFMPDNWSEWSENEMRILGLELKKYSNYFIKCCMSNQQPIEFSPITKEFLYVNKYKQHIINGTTEQKVLNKCGLGTVSCSVNYEGKLYGCQQTDTYKDGDNLYLIGDIYNGIDYSKHKLLKDLYMSRSCVCSDENYCKDCPCKEICNINPCHSTSYQMYDDLNIKAKVQCYWDRLLFNNALFIDNALRNNNFYNNNFFNRNNSGCGSQKINNNKNNCNSNNKQCNTCKK